MNYPHAKYIEVDFGEVEVGVTNIKSIRVVNRCNVRQSYYVQRDSASNPLDCVFHMFEYSWSLDSCGSYVCDISYRPILPNRKYVDYFFIIDTYGCCNEIFAFGRSAGPDVTVSPNRLILVCNDECCVSQKSFKLTNRSSCPAKFTFDIDVAQCPFQISKTSGVVTAASSKSFSVSFRSTSLGIHKYRLTCLVLNQAPLVLELYGICGCALDKEYISCITSKIEDAEGPKFTDSFADYMSDVTTAIKTDPPAISLSDVFLDFGHAKVGPESCGKRPPLTTSLTNHTNFGLLVLWEEDVSGVFHVHPQEAKMLANQSIVFEVRFDPLEVRALYSRELVARVFRLPCCPSLVKSTHHHDLLLNVVPDIVDIRLIGHTYGRSSNDWLPQYEVPETVIMPACEPATPAYATFIVKNFGKQSLMFRFVPPATSHYAIKPMMGLVTAEQEHRVIAVQLFAESEGNHAHVERWACWLNGSPSNEIHIDLHGFAERPELIFGHENRVVFDPVHVNCRESLKVPVRNSTRHTVRFELCRLSLPEELSVEKTSGTVEPNETVFFDWLFQPGRAQVYDFGLTCRLATISDGKSRELEILVSATSAEGTLMAVPEDLDLGVLEYNELGDAQFTIFNFSPVTIHFLVALQGTGDPENQRDVKISQVRGSARPGKSEKFRVSVTPTRPGRHELVVEYFARPSATDDDPICLSQPKHLCKLSYSCYLSVFQVKDLLYQANSNKNLSKLSLWKSLNIDNLNCALKDLLPHQEALIGMTLPFDSLYENERLVIKLLVVNTNPVKPNERCTLSIEVTSNPLQLTGLFWDLNIGQERRITLNINFELPVIASGDRLKFKSVFLGQRTNAQHQAIWLYNGEENEIAYAVETKSLAAFNKKNYGVIFSCLDPEGTIGSYERKAVVFSFCPNKIGTFQATVLVTVDQRESLLGIEAQSTSIKMPIVANYETCPASYTFLSEDIIVYFNKDYIITPPLPTFGRVTQIVIVHNHHQRDVLHYQWQNYEIPGALKVKVNPMSGLIQPQSRLTFLIEVVAGKYTCSLDIDVFCNFTNVSERRLAEKRKARQDDLLRQLKDEFTITDKGISYPKKPEFEEVKETSTYCKALTIKVDVYDPRDTDSKVELKQHLKIVTPIGEITRDTVPSEGTFSEIEINDCSQILECTIWDIINCNSFDKTLKNDLTTVHNLKYSQLPTDIVKRKIQNGRSDCVLPKHYIEDILHTIICMSVHEEFNLNTNHFSHPTDAREISYHKVYSEASNEKAE
ncbi:cilia- and flagella-associated protein 65-like [Copidosoma floridanum]|uniref:cilia- and flagella-associated protein 65-like n=1 Tax=Copidosoma floridanum TaxID=29053 RepID=UPI0006C968E4|nr:cilia- and flagella-associated protein 65-like [Copidosoma floridanum]